MFLNKSTGTTICEYDKRKNAILLQSKSIRLGNGKFLMNNLLKRTYKLIKKYKILFLFFLYINIYYNKTILFSF